MCNKFTKWTIKTEHANTPTDKLLHSIKEEAGAILFNNTSDTMSSSVVFNSEGQSDSVRINLGNNHMVSFHTHPAKAYIDNNCVYGHPSGDDISHFIRLSLRGALNHAVFTLERVVYSSDTSSIRSLHVTIISQRSRENTGQVVQIFQRLSWKKNLYLCKTNRVHST